MYQHLVRVGVLGHVGRFTSQEAVRYARGARVVCRTPRGLEVGEVLAPAGQGAGESDGLVLRRVTTADDLLLARLERYRDDAYRACQARLQERGIAAVLMDVEHLFDGKSVYFYFLGEVTPELEELTAELAEIYEAKVQFRKFAEVLTGGCGPDCGTEAGGAGCGTGGCSTCAIGCGKRA